MAKTWDTSRTGGGTYEFSQDAQGRYTLNPVGFKGINKLDLPELKTGAAATTAADTSKKDIAALSAQTTQAFGDVTPFYYDKDEDEASKYIRRKEDKDRDETIAPITYAEAKKRMTQDEAYTRPEYSTTRPSGIDTPMKKPLPKWAEDADTRGWSTEAKPKEVTQVGRQNVDEILAKRAEADKIKKVKPLARQPTPEERFASTAVGIDKTPRPFIGGGLEYDTQYTTGKEFDVKPVDKGFIQKIIPQGVKDTYQYAMRKINTGTKFLRTAVGIVGGPFVSGATMLMGAVKETPQNKHDKQYFNADNTGRIVTINPTTGKQENASTSLYAGMNRVSLRGNLEKAGAKRIATREETISRKNYGPGDKFYDDTQKMKEQQNDYKDSQDNNIRDEGYTRTRAERKASPGRQFTGQEAGGGPGGNGGGNGGGKGIICTQMYQQTQLEDWKKTMQLWYIFQKKYLTIEHQEGYHFLFKPFVKGMKKSKILTAIGKYCAIARTKDLKHIMFGTSFSFTGRLVRLITEPICYLTGKIKSWL